MKKLFTLLAMTAFVAGANAQLFNDDFESYAAGSYIGAQSDVWTTWSGAVGGSEDAQVVTNQANSGTNSVYFTSPTTGGGGPQDVILPFGQVYTDGLFTFTTSMRIASGKQGYFNFQAVTTPGVTWTIDVTAGNGVLILSESAVTKAAAAYTPDEWFEISIEANLTMNLWKLFVDGELTGTFSNGTNQVASVDIFPVAGSAFWIDDVSFDWEEVTAPDFNLSAVDLSGLGSLGGPEYNATAKVRNNGVEEITSFDIELTYPGGTLNETVTDINLAAGEYYEVEMGGIVLEGGLQTITVEVSNINGLESDDNPDDDIYVLTANIIAAAVGKRAVVEEGTGTWCQYCPRGAVTMERMSNLYGDSYVGIAVHNGDPMAVAVYDDGLNLNAFPAGKVDRGPQIGDGEFEQGWLNRMQVAPKAYVSVGAQYDEVSRLLEVVVDAEMIQTVTGNYRIGLAITEDGVTGVGSGWSQSNAFSGGTLEVGGYENLPNPVPASMMVYDHVARAILPNFSGASNIYNTAEYITGETYGFNFSITLPVGWDVDELNLVGMFYAPNNRIDNAYGITLDGAIENGWHNSGNFVGLAKLPEPEATIKLYPNPSEGLSFIQIDLETAENVSVDILSVDGRLIASRDYGVLATTSRLPVNTANYAAGIYMVQIKVGNTQKVLKLLVD